MTPRPIPADFASNLHLSNKALKALYRAGEVAILRWRTEANAPWQNVGPRAKPIPDDFAQRWETSSQQQLAEHYGVSTTLTLRWCKRLGLTRPAAWYSPQFAAKPKVSKPVQPKASLRAANNGFMTGPVDRPRVNITPAGRAVTFLRRLGPVIRCDATGRYDENGQHWRRGSTILTADEVIERAVRNGWRDEWSAAA